MSSTISSPTAPISIFKGAERNANPRGRASTMGNLNGSFGGPPKPLIGSMPTPSFLGSSMPPLALPPSSWEKESVLGGRGDSEFMGASSVPRDNRFAEREISMRSPLVRDDDDKVPNDSLGSSIPFPNDTRNIDFGDRTEPPVVVKARIRTRSNGLETTLERVLSSSLLGYNESDALSPTGARGKPSQVDFPTLVQQPQPPSNLSQLMGSNETVPFPPPPKTCLITSIEEISSSPVEQQSQQDDYGFIDDLEEEEEAAAVAAAQEAAKREEEINKSMLNDSDSHQTKFGSGNFDMFIDSEPSPKSPQVSVPPRPPFGSFSRGRSGSSPLSNVSPNSLATSLTALSMLETTRTLHHSSSGGSGSFSDSGSWRERESTDAVVIPSPVPFPAALRKLSMEVETRRAAARSFDGSGSLNSNNVQQKQEQDARVVAEIKPSNNAPTISREDSDDLVIASQRTSSSSSSQIEESPERRSSRNNNALSSVGLTDSAEWEALRQEPMEEPFDMEV